MFVEENGTSILVPAGCDAQKEGHICLRKHSDLTKNPQICFAPSRSEFTKHLDYNYGLQEACKFTQ